MTSRQEEAGGRRGLLARRCDEDQGSGDRRGGRLPVLPAWRENAGERTAENTCGLGEHEGRDPCRTEQVDQGIDLEAASPVTSEALCRTDL